MGSHVLIEATANIVSDRRWIRLGALGLGEGRDFRISIAGAQRRPPLLDHGGGWLKPTGATPTTHTPEPQIGKLPDGIDLSDGVENEFYRPMLLRKFPSPA